MREQVRSLPSAKESFRFSRDHPELVRPDWADVRVGVMYAACFAKFSQGSLLRALLLSTGDRILVETSPVDPFWGVGVGTGDFLSDPTAHLSGDNNHLRAHASPGRDSSRA